MTPRQVSGVADPMDRHTGEVLGFPRVLGLLAEGAATPQGRARCLELAPLPTPEAARAVFDEVAALSRLEPEWGLPPTGGVQAVEALLDEARLDGSCLEVEELLAVRDTVAACQQVYEYLEEAQAVGSLLGGYLARMQPQYELLDRFERTFGPRGEVLDGASAELHSLRARLRQQRARILRTLEGLLRDRNLAAVVQEGFVTLRGAERYVVPLRTDFRGHLEGIVHDRSRSGATFFVEPLEVVELNNELGSLQEEEAAEIRRVLRALSRWLGDESSVLRGNMAVTVHCDVLRARWLLSRRLDAVAPRLTVDPVLAVRGARHPLLQVQQPEQVVPVDLLLGGAERLLLVTGANAGGKTVALKTAGLTVLMAQAGLHVPAAPDSVVGWFDGVFAAIGDEQDIDRQLSTFSAHVVHLKVILERAGAGCLVLLDELGTGTDPGEGVGLAMAVLDELMEQGAVVLATTHLAGLKAYAYSRPQAQNVAVAFDPASGRPLFRLVYGQAGASNALDVAEGLGLPSRVVARARRLAAGEGEETATLLRELELAREEAVRAAAAAEQARSDWQRRVEEQGALLDEARGERDTARREARREADLAVREARREFREIIAGFARREVGQQETEAALAQGAAELAAALTPELPEVPTAPLEHVSPGDAVYVASVGKRGRVEELDPGGPRVAVRVGPLRLWVSRDELSAAPEDTAPGAAPHARISVQAERGHLDVVVVGCTVEDALGQVDKALNRALLVGAEGFRVVHGRGAGVLRRRLREHLGEEPQVRSWHPNQGDAATWVDLG
ncbi:MAG: Smr/MutS family protein [Deferrisomatales bacterium]|nr:Smr/MutS family protein [Deferrisomatales bacterium]